MLKALRGKIINAATALKAHRARRALLKASVSPEAAQTNLLRELMRKNAETEFGKKHGFAGVKTPEDYRKAVPVQTYEDLLPYIERQELTGEPCLTAEKPERYICTSGTTGTAKYIPVTPAGFEHFMRHSNISAHTCSKIPGLFRGKILSMTESAVLGHMPGGAPYGSAGGMVIAAASKPVKSMYLLQEDVIGIEDYTVRSRVIAALILKEKNVTCVITAFPSVLEAVLRVINGDFTGFMAALKTGGPLPGVPDDVPHARGLKISRARAEALEAAYAAQGRLDPKDLWPDLKGFVAWTAGSAGAAMARILPSFPPACRVVDIAFVASEVRGSCNINARTNVCLPHLLDVFFEFVERSAWESGAQDFIGLHELKRDKEYYIFITTRDGLYRYNMNDVVRVNDISGRTPTFVFVQKGGGVTNISGEKIYEAQIVRAAPEAFAEAGIDCSFYVLLADHDASTYRLCAEPASPPPPGAAEDVRTAVDVKLQGMNVAYRVMRANGALKPLELSWLRSGAADAYSSERMKTGKVYSQIKYVHVQDAADFAFPLHEWTAE